MARYAHLSMYKTAMDLTVYLEQVVPGWPTSLAEKFRRAQWRFRTGIYPNRHAPMAESRTGLRRRLRISAAPRARRKTRPEAPERPERGNSRSGSRRRPPRRERA